MLFPEFLLLKKKCAQHCFRELSFFGTIASEIHHATLPSLKNNLVTCRSKSFYTLACLDPRGPFVLLPLVNLSARNENLDPLYTGMNAT